LRRNVGLDGVVYKRAGRLPANVDRDLIRVDDVTGEVTGKDGSAVFERESPEALSLRLGNLADIGNLREILVKKFPHLASSIILTKILYSGSHSGDAIPYVQIEPLKKEIEFIRRAGAQDRSPELDQFLLQMDELIAAAESEGNPIAFV
jgi:hypothetical protein